MGPRWLASFVVLFVCLAVVDAKAAAIFGFGDSYADTGNREAAADSWKVPYGVSWPGNPGGRWCDGHLQTDVLASVLGVPSPTPYRFVAQRPAWKGINFALGSTGVLEETAPGLQDLSQQVDSFSSFVPTLFPRHILAHSVALVSVSGNDYGAWDRQDPAAFVLKIVTGIKEALTRLIDLGVGHIIVPNLPPFDCAPTATWTQNYTQCTDQFWGLVELHNSMLADVIQELDQKSAATTLLLLDQFSCFVASLKEFAYPLRPCCKGVDDLTTFCSSVTSNGEKAYTLCDDPTQHFFFDTVHPSQTGWRTLLNRYLEEPGYLVHYPTLTLRDYLIQNKILNAKGLGRRVEMVLKSPTSSSVA
eukprot:TRINITY_DN18763_c0_g1_i1.p1 TRINITY_DN18763_c0_g1~~TRINITY_DN18763_c0_g1_i1.p1  ORF type:complete len:391 (-),score=17.34 TRINITY_DN18763_c0_g1_i1:319-1398(-)